jgi:hypothetical protein
VGFRTKAISKNAASFMEAGEEIEELAIVRAHDGGGNYAVAATPRNVYVFSLTGLGFGKVGERVAKIAMRKASVETRSSVLVIGRRGAGEPEQHVFLTLPGGGPKRLAAYVADRAPRR